MEASLIKTGYVKSVFSRNIFIEVSTLIGCFLRWQMHRYAHKLSVTWFEHGKGKIYMLLCRIMSTNRIIKIYEDFPEKVRLGLLEKTERFWISFFNDVKLVFMLIFSVKSNNKKLFHKCNGEMANVLFAYNGQSYSMWMFWLSDIWLE